MCTISSNMNLIFHTALHCGVFVVYWCIMRVLISVLIDTRRDLYLMGHLGTVFWWHSSICSYVIVSICYQYMPLAQHELLRCETVCYIMMHYAVECITLHHNMVLYRSFYLMMPSPFISYHKIVMFDIYVYSVIEHSLCAIWHPRGYHIYHHTEHMTI